MAEKTYMAGVCLNSLYNSDDEKYCNNGFLVAAPPSALSLQCISYCDDCISKGFINPKSYKAGRLKREEIITEVTGYQFTGRKPIDEEHRVRLVESAKIAREHKLNNK